MSNRSHPIGVVVPTYNRPDVLRLCLRHLERQTWTDFEVVVVDDGSSPATREAVEAHAAAGPLALRFVRQENSGPARARNLAVSLLRSEVCLLIGDDILAHPELVERHLALHRRDPRPHVAGLGWTRWSESGQTVTPFMRWLDADGLQFAYGDLLRGAAPTWRHFYTSNLSLKTGQLRKHPFNESFRKAAMEDMELAYRMTVERTHLRSCSCPTRSPSTSIRPRSPRPASAWRPSARPRTVSENCGRSTGSSRMPGFPKRCCAPSSPRNDGFCPGSAPPPPC